jgi:predicted acylesterase/phospholipase RssA
VKYDLVFEGGGAKGMVFVGACQEFFGRGHEVGRVLGTSAGAITAAVLAAGYSPQELFDLLAEKGPDNKSVFAGFMGPPAPFTDEELRTGPFHRLLEGIDFTFVPGAVQNIAHDMLLKGLATYEQSRHLVALVDRGGWFSADRFVSWLSEKMNSGCYKGVKRNFSRMTLEQFFDATGTELSVVASDETDGKMLVLNHRTAPGCPLVWAVRMSMSIPLVWSEVIWQSTWGAYLGRDIAGHSIVDGGLLSNFPMELFLSDAPYVTKLMGPKGDNPVLGLLIDEKLPVSKGLFVHVNLKLDDLPTLQRLERLVDAATSAHDKMVMDEYSQLVVHLPAAGYGTVEFGMNDERRNALVNAGREAMANYLDTPAGLVLPGETKAATGEPVLNRTDRIAASILN